MRYLCLVNPVSGAGKGAQVLAELEKLKQRGILQGEVREYDVSNLFDIAKLKNQFDAILVAGGDGSVSGMLPTLLDSELPLALLPLGTGNDLARELAWNGCNICGASASESLKRFDGAKSCKLDIWRLCFGSDNHQSILFCNYLSFGFDAEVVKSFDAWRKQQGFATGMGKQVNRLAYFFYGIANFSFRLKKVEIEAAGQRSEFKNISGLIFSNIKSYMGMGMSNPFASFADGKLEAMVISGAWNYLKLAWPGARLGPAGIQLPANSSWQVGFPMDGVAVQVDGEARLDLNYRSYTIVRAGSINVLAPE